jgi:hypothetical protein
LEAIWPAVAVKPAETVPAATVTEDGADSSALFVASATVDPAEGAAALSVTVQALAESDIKVDGPHCTDDTVGVDPDADDELPIAIRYVSAYCVLYPSIFDRS